MHDQFVKWQSEMPQAVKKDALNQNDKAKKNLEGTAGTEHPRYIMFWTNEDQLNLIAEHFAQNDAELEKLLPLGPSSTIVFELTT